VETADGERILLAPIDAVAEFVSSTYSFDHVLTGQITVGQTATEFTVSGPGLDVVLRIGGAAAFDWLLRLVPGAIAMAPWWLRVIAPAAALLVPGVRTAGTAGHGRRRRPRWSCRPAPTGAVRFLLGSAVPAAGFGDDDDRAGQLISPAAPRPAARPEKMQPPRKVPSSAR
jgi:hypothetical protein